MINFGIFPEEDVTYSYIDIEISLMISLLLESGAIDFVVTGSVCNELDNSEFADENCIREG